MDSNRYLWLLSLPSLGKKLFSSFCGSQYISFDSRSFASSLCETVLPEDIAYEENTKSFPAELQNLSPDSHKALSSSNSGPDLTALPFCLWVRSSV
jgi:hypothetical protein